MKRPGPGSAAAAQGADPLAKLLRDALKCLQEDQLGEGEALCGRALRVHPGNSDAHHLLGLIMHRSGKTDDAIAQVRHAIAGNRRFAPFHNSLGTMLAESGQLAEAAPAFQKAIELQPNYPEAISNLGSVFKNARRFDESAQLHRRAIALKPDYPDAHNNLGNTLLRQENAAAAVDVYRAAVRLRPNHAIYRNNLAAALIEDDRLEDAIAEIHAALRLQPDYAEAYSNLGRAFADGGHYDEALAAYRTALRTHPNHADALYGEGQVLLLRGDYASGWAKYDSRWSLSVLREPLRHGEWPYWDGSTLVGRRILVWDEQGIGDKIMFAKALPNLLASCRNCVLEVEPRLAPLFTRSFPTAEAVVPCNASGRTIEGRAFDVQSAIGSLCRWLLPNPVSEAEEHGYLRADPALTRAMREHYRKSFGERSLVGLSWRGGTGKKKQIRSIPLLDLTPILKQTAFTFVSLQYGDIQMEVAQFSAGTGITLHTDESINALENLDRFAAQTAAMDLVITIDNSTAHMAGALGVPVWVMLPAVPEWRWLLDRTDSVWYPSARLFRQKTRGDWAPVIEQAAAELRDFRPAPGAAAARSQS